MRSCLGRIIVIYRVITQGQVVLAVTASLAGGCDRSQYAPIKPHSRRPRCGGTARTARGVFAKAIGVYNGVTMAHRFESQVIGIQDTSEQR